jgi:hypothetical protein
MKLTGPLTGRDCRTAMIFRGEKCAIGAGRMFVLGLH